jgi:hypothetical protein
MPAFPTNLDLPQLWKLGARMSITQGENLIMPDPKLKNVFEAILKYGHDEDFAPRSDEEFRPTKAPAGSREKLEVLADRVRRGYPLWHEEDRADYSGLTGAVRPRD